MTHLLHVAPLPPAAAAGAPGLAPRHGAFARGAAINVAADGTPHIAFGTSAGAVFLLELNEAEGESVRVCMCVYGGVVHSRTPYVGGRGFMGALSDLENHGKAGGRRLGRRRESGRVCMCECGACMGLLRLRTSEVEDQ